MASYVKFVRATPEAFKRLRIKNSDTLYFIRDNTADDQGALYLGETLISGNGSNLGNLDNILIDTLKDNDLLIYDKGQEAWINQSIIKAIGYFTGVAPGTGGLVPAPSTDILDTGKVFLRGDGVWTSIETGLTGAADNKTISLDNATIGLKDFGKQYYKYVPASDTVAAHYELQIVDIEHPWFEGLEPRTVLENNEYVLGWFEPNTETLDGVNNSITILSTKVGNLENELNKTNNNINTIKNDLFTINTKVVNLENILNNFYTKTEVDNKIQDAISSTSGNSLFTAINDSEFTIDDNRILNIKNIAISKITNLETILNSKALQSDLDDINTRLNNLDFVTHAELEESIKSVNQSALWGEL